MGKCTKGPNCNYAHGVNELRPKNICVNFLKGQCQ